MACMCAWLSHGRSTRGHTLCDRFRALDRRSAYLPSLGIRGARNAMADVTPSVLLAVRREFADA